MITILRYDTQRAKYRNHLGDITSRFQSSVWWMGQYTSSGCNYVNHHPPRNAYQLCYKWSVWNVRWRHRTYESRKWGTCTCKVMISCIIHDNIRHVILLHCLTPVLHDINLHAEVLSCVCSWCSVPPADNSDTQMCISMAYYVKSYINSYIIIWVSHDNQGNR